MQRDRDFQNEAELQEWLTECTHDWERWVRQEWLLKLRTHVQDIEAKIERGAETTLIACTIQDSLFIDVFAIGDANFFLLRPSTGLLQPWERIATFPNTRPESITAQTHTLATASKYHQRAWRQIKRERYVGQPNDCAVLTTDALALWLLKKMERGDTSWMQILAQDTQEKFREFVHSERATGAMVRDDTTMMVIPLRAMQNRTRG